MSCELFCEERMKLYKLILAYGYDYQKSFTFMIIAKDVKQAEELAIKTFRKYDYGDCHLHTIEVIAEEGQYAKPNILLISDESK